MAVLTDDRKSWKPQKYGYELWDSKASLEFTIVKLLDYRDDFDMLAQNDNPFAIVVMAHLKAIETRKEPVKRFRWKLHLAKMLYQRGYSKQDVLNLFRFIDWIMALPEEMEDSFDQKIIEYKEERKMRYVTHIERKGIEKGFQQEAYKLLARLLKKRFGVLPEWTAEKMQNAPC